MKINLSFLTLAVVFLFVASATAQNRAVVIPLNSGGGGGAFTSLIKDSDSSVVGKVIGVDGNSRWTIINTKNYLVSLDAAGWPRGEVVYFTGTDCTGTPMLNLVAAGSANPSISNPIYGKQGYVFTEPNQSTIWYIAPGTAATAGQAHQSRYLTTGCQNTADSADAILAAPNNEIVTGVPDTGYGNVSLK
jgi:hypothetical protein